MVTLCAQAFTAYRQSELTAVMSIGYKCCGFAVSTVSDVEHHHTSSAMRTASVRSTTGILQADLVGCPVRVQKSDCWKGTQD